MSRETIPDHWNEPFQATGTSHSRPLERAIPGHWNEPFTTLVFIVLYCLEISLISMKFACNPNIPFYSRLDSRLYKFCRSDARELCQAPKNWHVQAEDDDKEAYTPQMGYLVFACLYRHVHPFTSDPGYKASGRLLSSVINLPYRQCVQIFSHMPAACTGFRNWSLKLSVEHWLKMMIIITKNKDDDK